MQILLVNAGICHWDKNCWFKHSEDIEVLKKDFKCTVCEEIFKNKMNFVEHRKSVHANLTPKCKNNSYGYCDYGVIYWFRLTEEMINNEEDDEIKDG